MLQQQLDVLQSMLKVAQGHADNSEDAFRKLSRPNFNSNETLFRAASGLA